MHAASAERAVAALAASQHSAFGRRQAASLGFTPRMIATRLKSGVLAEPISGVLVFTSAPRSWKQQLMVAVIATGGVASHRAAGAFHRLDGCPEAELDVIVAHGRQRVVPGAIVHRTVLDSRDVVVVDGIPCTNMARTLCDLGAVLNAERVEQALDDALRRGVSERLIRETLSRVHRPGRTGSGVLRHVLALPDRRGPLADSSFERLVERLLADSWLPAPTRQLWVRERGGNRRARLDLAWPEAMLAVEPAGARFHGGARRQRADEARRAWLAAQGWFVIEVHWSELSRPDLLRARIEDAYGRRRPELAAESAL
jgi:hypothetical protein